jgi:transposase
MTERFVGKDGFNHTHGSSAAYLQGGCRCDLCRSNRSQKQTARRKQIAYGRYQNALVDAEPVREHMAMLMSYGIGINRIAKMAGVSHQTVYPLMYGRSSYDIQRGKAPSTTRIKRESAERLLALKPAIADLPDIMQISNRGFVRRVQALNCLGYTTREIGSLLGFKGTSQVYRMIKGNRILVVNHRAMCDLYQRLEFKPAVATNAKHATRIAKTKAHAEANGFIPPAGWDDIDYQAEVVAPDPLDFDTLLAELLINPKSVQIPRSLRGQFYVALRERGWNDGEIADAIGIAKSTVYVWFKRNKPALMEGGQQ